MDFLVKSGEAIRYSAICDTLHPASDNQWLTLIADLPLSLVY